MTIDRISPTLRPSGRTAMHHRWEHLLFLHWEVEPDRLQSFLPPGLEIDTYEDKAYIGLVPFTMTGVRPVWLPPVRAYSDFQETNVRIYVHRQGRDPGVWFFSLDAANALAVRVARAVWKLPYHFARMELHQECGLVRYSSERFWPGPTPACCSVECRPSGQVRHAEVGSWNTSSSSVTFSTPTPMRGSTPAGCIIRPTPSKMQWYPAFRRT